MKVPLEEILKFLKSNQLNKLRDLLKDENPVDIAGIIDDLSKEESLKLFRVLPKDLSSDTFSYLAPDKQQEIVENITDEEVSNIISDMFIDDTVDFIEEMPANIVDKILQNTAPEMRNLINQLLKYPENSAGSVMTVEYLSLKSDMSVGQAIHSIKRCGIDNETIDICYIIDYQRRLVGFITLKKLIFLDDDIYLRDVMETNVLSCHTIDDQEKIANDFRKYDLTSMPVVDNEDRLVGIITIDDVVDVIDQENTEDFQKLAGMRPSDEEYLKESIFSLVKQRIGWLMLLMILATFTGIIIRHYGNSLRNALILISFTPMLMSTGGNAGSQSSTLITRGIALDEISTGDLGAVFKKELGISIIIGFILSVVNFGIIYISSESYITSFVISVSLFIIVVVGKVIGGILPIVAKSLKLDPAVIASPFITTIIDACALIVFFLISTHYLPL